MKPEEAGVKPDETEQDYVDFGNLDDIPDEHAVPAAEYELKLITLEKRPQKKHPEKSMLYIQFELPDDPLSKLITHVIMLAHPDDDKRTFMRRQRAVKYFYTAFDIPLSGGVKLSEYVGNKCWAILTEESSEEYGDQNRIARFVARG